MNKTLNQVTSKLALLLNQEFVEASIQHTFKDFNIAYYTGLKGCEKTQTLIKNSEMT